MIKKYKGFITEKLRYDIMMLLESQLYGSSEFLDKLQVISKEKNKAGEIAMAIIDFIESENWLDDRDIKQNFFNTTDTEDKVSFLMQNKIPKDWDEEKDPSLPYNTKGRGEVSVGKLIKYILNLLDKARELNIEMPKDKDIESFVNIYKSTTSSTSFKFKLLKGDDIAKYYNSKKYLNEAGSLGGSCMAEESKGTFKMYSENESKVQLLVYIDEKLDKISGRALVWKLKDSPCEAKYFMDRVYTNRDSDFFKFRQYAEEKGYLYKQKMNSYVEDNVSFIYKGSEVYGEITVKLDAAARNYPFVDTMCFLNKDKTLLSNLSFKDAYFLHSVAGDCEPCNECDGKCISCGDCYNNELTDCQDCDGSGDTDSGKCVTCKGKGEIKCEHKDADLCNQCGGGHQTLARKGVATKLNNL